jgi:hypothetical protein
VGREGFGEGGRSVTVRSSAELARAARCAAADYYGISGARHSSETLHGESIGRGCDFVLL